MNSTIVCLKLNSQAKNNKQKESIESTKNAFFIEGGGTRGIYAIGVLKYLFENNSHLNLDSVNIFGGTSVGSFLATALSMGFQKDDIIQISKIINIADLIDKKYMFMITAYRFCSQGYLYDDIGRQKIICQILDFKIDMIKQHLGLGNDKNFRGKDLTFAHLKTLIALYPNIYKHLLINVVDISRSEQIFMSSLNDKCNDIKLFDAILASSAIPAVFKPVKLYFNPDLDKYNYHNTENSLETYLVDGGISSGNPLDFFLLNDHIYSEYELWLIKFVDPPQYTKIDGFISLLKNTIDYLVSGKNNIKMKLVEETYCINTINLHSKAGTFDIYTQPQIQTIIDEVYNQCLTGMLYFDNKEKIEK